jgi:hypothetical protein
MGTVRGIGVAAVLIASTLGAGCTAKDNPLWGLTDGESQGQGSSGGATSAVSTTGSSSASGPSSDSSGTTSATTTGTSSTVGETDETGGEPATLCGNGQVYWTWDFAALPEDGQGFFVVDNDGVTPTLDAGALEVVADIPTTLEFGRYWILGTFETIPPEGSVVVELRTGPRADAPTHMWVRLSDDAAVNLHFHAHVGVLSADQDELAFAEQAFDPQRHRWLRISYSAATSEYRFETAETLGDWQPFATRIIEGLDLSEAWVEVALGAWNGPLSAELVGAIDNFTLCEL